MIRSVLAVLGGIAVWAVLWIGTNGGLAAALPGSFAEDGSTDSAGILLVILVASLVFSVVAGWLTGRAAPARPIAHAVALGAIQLALGLLFQISVWELMPLWFHLPFLVLLVPGNVAGGWLALPGDLARRTSSNALPKGATP